jgi:CRISPR/Cas system Type II protein with McrA/HNH and RuvC-like nuclease domain
MKYWLQKLIDVLITESERFEKIKKDCLEETFGKEPKEEDLVLKYEDGSVNEKAVEFQAKINELAEEIVEVEHFAFNDNHLSNLKTTYHYIPNEDKTNQVIVTSEDTTGKYVNQEFIPQLFLRKLVEPCI